MTKPHQPSRYHRFVAGAAARIVADLPPDQREQVRQAVMQHLHTELRGTFGIGQVEMYVPSIDTQERHDLEQTMIRALEAGQPAAVVARTTSRSFRSVYALARRVRGNKNGQIGG